MSSVAPEQLNGHHTYVGAPALEPPAAPEAHPSRPLRLAERLAQMHAPTPYSQFDDEAPTPLVVEAGAELEIDLQTETAGEATADIEATTDVEVNVGAEVEVEVNVGSVAVVETALSREPPPLPDMAWLQDSSIISVVPHPAADAAEDVPHDMAPHGIEASPTGEPMPDTATGSDDSLEARTVAAAAELVTLLSEQRTLLDAMTRLRTQPPDVQRDTLPDAAPLQLLSSPSTTADVTGDDHEKPPIVIERAHADQRAGGTGFDTPYVERPSRLPGFAGGFALAMLTGAILYLWRLA
ncbi:MAG: hypothetical protein ACKVP7_26585 [Hyphomicrobiaceae bacterium]